jgi:glycosyltransferase involved in cell wall biosynthesis
LTPRIAVLIPCYNEAEAIAGVVRDFAAALPEATIYVYDNNSRDATRERAAQAGAVVRSETHQGTCCCRTRSTW